MTPKKRILTVVLTLALGLGVWTLAFTFQAADFAEGDVLSAGELNSLLNDNFQAASDAVDTKVDRAGDTVTGRLNVEAAATSEGDLDAATVFRVQNTDTSAGSAAIFQGENASDNGVVSIKQNGAGPALSLKANGGGPLIVGAGALDVNFAVDADGSVRIGSMGPDGTEDPTLHLDATAGTVTNDVGSGLPLAFGTIDAAGTKLGGTSNWTVTTSPSGETYYLQVDGVDAYDPDDYVIMVTLGGTAEVLVPNVSYVGSPGSASAEPAISLRDPETDARVPNEFQFVMYAPGL